MSEQAQTSLYEREIEDAELEAALDLRAKKKDDAGVAKKAADEADAAMRALVAKYELGEGSVVRVGKYVLTNRKVKGRAVAFETAATTRLQIALFESDE